MITRQEWNELQEKIPEIKYDITFLKHDLDKILAGDTKAITDLISQNYSEVNAEVFVITEGKYDLYTLYNDLWELVYG